MGSRGGGRTPPTTMPTVDHRLKRILKEMSTLWIDLPDFCRPGASPVTDPFHFAVVIDGPDGSPYAGGTFPVDVVIPRYYPFRPPKLTFKTKVYHPNIDEEGKMYLDIFGSNWSPALTISKVLVSVISVLYDPLLDLPVRPGVAHQYKHERGRFEKKARNWTRRYASTPVASLCPAKAAHSGLDYLVVPGAIPPVKQRRAAFLPGWWPVSYALCSRSRHLAIAPA